jgi:site-specific recombinase XerC
LTPDLDGFRAHLTRRGEADATIVNYISQVRQPGGPERVRSRALAPKSRRVVLAAWRAYARFLARSDDPTTVKDGALLLADLADVKLPSAVRKTPQIPLPRPLYVALRAAIDTDPSLTPAERAALGIIACRGLRSTDVRRIRRTEVAAALKGGILSFTAKGEKQIEFGVTPVYRGYLEILAEEFEGSGQKFVWELLAPTSASAHKSLERLLKRVARTLTLEDYGVDLPAVRLHIMRRTYAVAFSEAVNGDIVRLMKHMQWANIATAANYVDHSRREDDAVAEEMLR